MPLAETPISRAVRFTWQGALSTLEKILPLADKFGAITLLKTFVNVSPGVLQTGAVSPIAPTSPSPARSAAFTDRP